jgi:GNAT superfamily N-acetyltransferase
MEIRPIDVSDDAEVGAWYRARHAARQYEREGMPGWSELEAKVILTLPESSADWRAAAAFDGDVVVGATLMFLPLLDNVDFAMIEVNVPPGQRRRGIGTALLGHLVDTCREIGRSTLLMESDLPFHERDGHPYRKFAERNGFTLANVEIRRTLALPVAEAKLDEWAAAAAPHHHDYRLMTFHEETPEELLESYCYLLNQLALDAPTGDIDFEAEAITPDALREREKKLDEGGRIAYSTIALDQNGDAVAHSVLCLDVADSVNIQQFGTLVHRDHRGHRLGLAVKSRNLLEVQRAYPDRQRVVTTNAETNDHMVAINELMGFEPVELLAEFQRKL